MSAPAPTIRWEWKVLLSAEQAERVRRQARALLAQDPYALRAADGGYPVASVYLAPADGPRAGTPRWRVRRYGDDRQLWLERKQSRNGRVEKRRAPVEAALALARAADVPPAHPASAWLTEVETLGLTPAVVVSYLREAWVLPGTGARLTIDRHLRARPAQRRTPESVEGGVPVTADSVLELKFDGSPPAAFREVLREQGLAPRRWSKVRAAVEALALRPLLGPGRAGA